MRFPSSQPQWQAGVVIQALDVSCGTSASDRDLLTIYSGPTTASPVLFSGCQVQPAQLPLTVWTPVSDGDTVLSTWTLLVTFTSTSSGPTSGVGQGFQLQATAAAAPAAPTPTPWVCPGPVAVTVPAGQATAQVVVNGYKNLMDCVWMAAASDSSLRVVAAVTSFSLSTFLPNECDYDKVRTVPRTEGGSGERPRRQPGLSSQDTVTTTTTRF